MASVRCVCDGGTFSTESNAFSFCFRSHFADNALQTQEYAHYRSDQAKGVK